MERLSMASVLLLLVLIIPALPSASAMSWRLFAGREECVHQYLSDGQWSYIMHHRDHPDHSPVYIDLAILVTSKYGTEDAKANVDFAVYSPTNQLLHSEHAVSESEVGVNGEGGRGPWKVCFRVSSGALLRPSVIVKIGYFLVNYDDVGSQEAFEWESLDSKGESLHHVPASNLGSQQQIESLEHGLMRLDHYLHNVTNEQRYLYARTVRHLKTAESTLKRTFWYYVAIYIVICLASFSQLIVVRFMFKKSRKQGLII